MSPELTVEGDIRWSGMLSWRETALPVKHVCIHRLKSAPNPWPYSASRINSSFQLPPGSCSGSGTTLGQTVVLRTANLHLYSVRRCLSSRPVATSHVACKALGKRRMISCDHVLLWWQWCQVYSVPRDWPCPGSHGSVFLCTEIGEALPKLFWLLPGFRKEMSQTLSCAAEVVKPGCNRPSSIPLKSLEPLPLIK